MIYLLIWFWALCGPVALFKAAEKMQALSGPPAWVAGFFVAVGCLGWLVCAGILFVGFVFNAMETNERRK